MDDKKKEIKFSISFNGDIGLMEWAIAFEAMGVLVKWILL